ncbi:MoaF-related domain-containing protein [Streptomyces sp. NPDC002817]|uniref:MoaF-related domain-containing protein n=1 Tax=Streptomyces sp. NPDC088357 TaxID=3154655 RepID=UPI00343FFEC1
MSDLTYAGRTFRFGVDNGVVFHNTYAPDGTRLHYETVAGPDKGVAEDVELHAAEVGPGIFILGWLEASGMTITHAMNLNTGTVHAFWTYETPDGRVGELHTGTLEEIQERERVTR